MFLLLPCATIKDKVELPAVGEVAKIAGEMNKARQNIRQYSNVEYLLKRITEGEVIMTKKIEFDAYMKAQVDLMKACVSSSRPCPFSYTSYMDSEKTVTTSGLSTKEQWAIEMIMSRFTINSIYHAAAFSSLQFIFTETNSSYEKGYKNAPKLVTNLQIAYKYFNQGYQPLKRLAEVFDTLQQLFSKNNKQILDSIVETRKQVFLSMSFLVACNLAYLKLEKYRLMSEYRSCKELAYAVYNLIKDTKTVLTKAGLIDKVHPDMRVYLNLGELFFMAYSFYFLLEEHEDMKNKQDYGFVKKQFQQMIVQNTVICEEFEKIAKKISNFPNKQNLDNIMFADGLVQTMLKDVLKKKYAYGINIHQNKQLQVPTVEQVIASRIGSRNLWDSINQF